MVVLAVPAKRGVTKTITLNDGTTCQASLVGDEFGHYWEADNGRAFQHISSNSYFTEVDAKAINDRAQALRAEANALRIQRLPGIKKQGNRRVGSFGDYFGEKKALVILVNYTDVTFANGHDNALYQRIANEKGFHEGSFVGSLYDYFYAQSEGLFELTFDVLGPVAVSQNQAYYGGNDSSGDDQHPGQMVHEAVELVKDMVTDWKQYDWDNDGYVDQVYVIYAGNGEADSNVTNSIWPHAWDLNSSGAGAVTVGDNLKVNRYACGSELNGSNHIEGIGTMCHEFSHCLGYPDFYDTDYSGGQGMDAWDLMDYGSYNDNGYRPAGYTSYERWVVGWKDAIELNMGKLSVENMKGLQDGGDFYVMYNDGHPNEYFLLENRTLSGWDKSLPGSGLLIIHVDYNSTIWAWNRPNDDPSHQRMTWIPSDGSYNGNLGMDTYPNSMNGNDAFDDTSSPAAELYNKNTDGTKLLHKGIKNITKNYSDGTISFDFVGTSMVKTPEFSPKGGMFFEPMNVSITCATEGATIYYTTDGTDPTTASTVYTEPLNIDASITIKAIAVTADDESWIAEATYTYVPLKPTSKMADYSWKENFTGVGAQTAVENVVCEQAVYEGDNGAYCVVYNEKLAGGTAPELLIPNRNRAINTLKAYIALGDVFGDFTLTFKSNRSLSVSSPTAGVAVTAVGAEGTTYTYMVSVPEHTSVLQLEFTNGSSQNARIDDILLSKPPKEDPQLKFTSNSLLVNPADAEYVQPTLHNPYHFPVTYTSQNTEVATVDAETGVLTLTGNEGESKITAIFEGNDDYAAAAPYYLLKVQRDDPNLHFVEYEFTVKAKSSFTPPELVNELEVPVYYEAYDPEVADVDPKTGAVKIGKAGYGRIFANFDGSERISSDWCSYEITVEKLEHGLSFDQTEVEAIVGDTFTAPKLKNPNKLEIEYTSSDKEIATVDSKGVVTLGTKTGTATITATFVGDDYYEAGEVSYQIVLMEGTGISTLTGEKAAGEWYTIQGVHADKPAKGLYIHQGRKKVVK